jgi:hypothetical protein
LVASLTAALALALLLPLSAQASPLTEIEARHMPEIEQWVYRNSAVKSPMPCGSVCANLWRLEKGAPSETTAKVWDQLGALETSTGLWDDLGALAAALGTPALNVGTFEIG